MIRQQEESLQISSNITLKVESDYTAPHSFTGVIREGRGIGIDLKCKLLCPAL
jgi:hypothetical protein